MIETFKLNELNKENRLKLYFECSHKDITDYAIKMVNYNDDIPFIKMESVRINDDNRIMYDVTDFMKLSDCIKDKKLTQHQLIDCIYSIISVLVNAHDYFLNPEDIYLTEDYVYIDLSCNEVRVLYIPLKNDISKSTILHKVYIMDLLMQCRNYGIGSKSINDLIVGIRDDMFAIETVKSKFEGIMSEINGGDKNIYDNKVNEDQNINIDEKKDKQRMEAQEDIGLVIQEKDKTRTICLSKSTYLIGRFSGTVDIAVESRAVGRIHGRIERRAGFYFYIDLESKNGSYINGKRVEPNKRYQVGNGDELRLANVNMYIKKL